jgi:hypothetical protein
MQLLSRYVFFGGAFGIALVTLVIAGIGTSEAGTIAFLSQTDTSKTTPAELGQYQQLNCKTIEYDIKEAQLALSGLALSSTQNIQLVFGRISGKGDWEKLKKTEVGRSETVRFSSDSLDFVTFSFPSSIKAGILCPTQEDMAYMRLEGVNGTGLLIHGSAVDTYAGPLYNCVLDNGLPCTGTIIDMAFAFFTTPNNPPIIDAVLEKQVVELETLQFVLTVNDPDGDTVTWGSGNLPEGAVLDTETGEFTWTPTSDQVKDYKITFVATDDGGPIQESSSITVFVRVLNIETVVESNELLADTVIALGLENNISNSYIANTKNIETFLEKDQYTAVRNQLDVFTKKIEQDFEKGTITEEQYNTLLVEINEVYKRISTKLK